LEKIFYLKLDINQKNLLSRYLDYSFPIQEFMSNPFLSGSNILLRRPRQLPTAYACWGLNPLSYKIALKAFLHNKPLYLMEDGFLRSYCTAFDKRYDIQLRKGVGYTIDTKGFYFDGTRPTDLENFLNSYSVTAENKNKARQLIDKIIANKLSKYNNQPDDSIVIKSLGNNLVLVIDQTRADQSLVKGMVPDNVFETMISDALAENPSSTIVFKIHPQSLAENRIPSITRNEPRLRVLSQNINPISLLERVGKVYVATSQLGFEALMCGKEVKVYGMPFYAGWGLTTDVLSNPRRKRKLTIEEIFFIVYCVYSKYVNLATEKECTIDEAIDYLIQTRDKMQSSQAER
jgi:capsular polysaccharide export protein